jgi:ABC-type polysaccharide/polyol phosphate export permease
VEAAPVLTGSKALGITALVLSLASVVFGIVWFIAAPLAVTAVILAIVALVKKRNGKGLSIAATIIGGVSLLILIPFWFLMSVVALQGLQDYSQERENESLQTQGL